MYKRDSPINSYSFMQRLVRKDLDPAVITIANINVAITTDSYSIRTFKLTSS